jgi:hypothetical protein
MSEEEKMAVEQEEILVETPDDAPAEKEQPASDRAEASSGEAGEELDSYSKGVQSRIKKLTEKYRQEERDKAEAVRLSQQLMQENQALKGRVQALDTGYLSEYGTRLQTQTESAKRQYKEAYESGDTDRMLEAQQMLSNIAVEQQRYNTAKTRAEQQAQQRQAAPQQQAQAAPQQQQQQPRPKPDPRAESWASKNTWFGQDKIMTNAAYTLHHQLVEDEGFDPEADEYYNELDKRLRQEFPHKFQAKKTGGGSQVASAGNSASRSTKQGRRSVKLSHSQVAIAKKLGVPLEEYAKFVKD